MASLIGRLTLRVGRTLNFAFFLLFLFSLYTSAHAADPYAIVLGTAQDGGFPQAGCSKKCCATAWNDITKRRFVSCVAIVDPDSGQRWMLDCTPDFRDQLRLLDQAQPKRADGPLLDGIFPTHAHVGHYTGLMMLGREVLGAQSVPVYAMPKMKYFLESNGPWSQLVKLNQIEVKRLAAGQASRLNERITITPFLVPHRDEFSETVGFIVTGPHAKLAYLPDIDKWERWELKIESLIADVDHALLDGTFFDSNELPGRDMSEIPHPFVQESLGRFATLESTERQKVQFIHLNHSNPLLHAKSEARATVQNAGSRLARQWNPRTPQLARIRL